LIIAAIPATAQFKFNTNQGVLATSPVGAPLKFDVGVTAVNGTFNSVNYTLSGSLPAGLNFANVTSASGPVAEISGTPTTAGTSNFTITALANMSTGIFSGSLPLSIVINTPASVNLAPTSLTFGNTGSLIFGGIEFIDVTSAGTGQTKVSVALDDGNGGPAPAEFSISPTSSLNTPGRIFITYRPTKNSTAGKKNARLVLTPPNLPPVFAPLSGNTLVMADVLSIFPRSPRLRSRSGETGVHHRRGFVFNDGANPIPFTAHSLFSPRGLTVTPSALTTSPGTITPFDIAVDFDQLPSRNPFTDRIDFFSSVGNAETSFEFFPIPPSPILQSIATRPHATSTLGSTLRRTGQFTIYNIGDANSTANVTSLTRYAAGVTPFVNFGSGSIVQDGTGTVTPSKPFVLNFNFSPGTQAGLQSGLLTVTEQTDSSLIAQTALSQEIVPTLPAEAEISPPSLTFVPASGNSPITKNFTLSFSGAATTYSAAANTVDGGNWLSVSPTAGTLSSAVSPNFTVGVNPLLLPNRVNIAHVDIAVGGGFQVSEYIVAINPNSGQSPDHGGPAAAPGNAAACTPTQVIVVPGMIRSGFSRGIGVPEAISAEIYDDCGNSLTGAENTVMAVFDNGDAPMELENLGAAAGEGAYLGTWTPTAAQANTTITFVAISGSLKVGLTALNGAVNNNQLKLPVLFDNGTVNNTNPLGGPILSPGMVTSIYGLNLAPNAISPGLIPLPNTSNGTSVTIGGKPAPFYFLSAGQLNVQAPTDLATFRPGSVAVQVNSTFAVLPLPVSVLPVAPGVSSFADGHIIAQHADFSLVDAAHPAKPGEPLVMYLSGMGATTPAVATGVQASPTALTPAQIQPTVRVGGQVADIAYAGLTPGGIGLYQINFTVPAGTAPGDVEVIVNQNAVIANRTVLPVAAAGGVAFK
jgi:uncharacterized protein (TIGR03437 family)